MAKQSLGELKICGKMGTGQGGGRMPEVSLSKIHVMVPEVPLGDHIYCNVKLAILRLTEHNPEVVIADGRRAAGYAEEFVMVQTFTDDEVRQLIDWFSRQHPELRLLVAEEHSPIPSNVGPSDWGDISNADVRRTFADCPIPCRAYAYNVAEATYQGLKWKEEHGEKVSPEDWIIPQQEAEVTFTVPAGTSKSLTPKMIDGLVKKINGLLLRRATVIFVATFGF